MVEYVSILVLAIISLPGVKFTKKLSSQTLTADDCVSLKGFLCFLIFFNHFSGWFVGYGIIYYILNHTGRLEVALFFFVSGYGLEKKYGKSDISLIFLIRRITKIMVPYWLCEIVYSLVSKFGNIQIKEAITLKSFLSSFFLRGEIVENSWFVGAIFTLYVLWFISKKISRKFYIAVLLILMIAISFFVGWWTSFFAFPIGLIISNREDKPNKQKISIRILGFVLCLAVFIFGCFIKIYGQKIDKENLMNISDLISTVVFPYIAYRVLAFVKLNSNILKFFGKISYEIYLLHGLSIRIAFKVMTIDKPVLFLLFALALTIISSYLIRKIADLLFDSKIIVKR